MQADADFAKSTAEVAKAASSLWFSEQSSLHEPATMKLLQSIKHAVSAHQSSTAVENSSSAPMVDLPAPANPLQEVQEENARVNQPFLELPGADQNTPFDETDWEHGSGGVKVGNADSLLREPYSEAEDSKCPKKEEPEAVCADDRNIAAPEDEAAEVAKLEDSAAGTVGINAAAGTKRTQSSQSLSHTTKDSATTKSSEAHSSGSPSTATEKSSPALLAGLPGSVNPLHEVQEENAHVNQPSLELPSADQSTPFDEDDWEHGSDEVKVGIADSLLQEPYSEAEDSDFQKKDEPEAASADNQSIAAPEDEATEGAKLQDSAAGALGIDPATGMKRTQSSESSKHTTKDPATAESSEAHSSGNPSRSLLQGSKASENDFRTLTIPGVKQHPFEAEISDEWNLEDPVPDSKLRLRVWHVPLTNEPPMASAKTSSAANRVVGSSSSSLTAAPQMTTLLPSCPQQPTLADSLQSKPKSTDPQQQSVSKGPVDAWTSKLPTSSKAEPPVAADQAVIDFDDLPIMRKRPVKKQQAEASLKPGGSMLTSPQKRTSTASTTSSKKEEYTCELCNFTAQTQIGVQQHTEMTHFSIGAQGMRCYCKLCKVTCDSHETYISHMTGRPHARVERAVLVMRNLTRMTEEVRPNSERAGLIKRVNNPEDGLLNTESSLPPLDGSSSRKEALCSPPPMSRSLRRAVEGPNKAHGSMSRFGQGPQMGSTRPRPPPIRGPIRLSKQPSLAGSLFSSLAEDSVVAPSLLHLEACQTVSARPSGPARSSGLGSAVSQQTSAASGLGSLTAISAIRSSTESFRSLFRCPLTKKIMKDPVICADGFTYEKEAIKAYLEAHGRSPKTGEPVASTVPLMPARIVRQAAAEAGVELGPVKGVPGAEL